MGDGIGCSLSISDNKSAGAEINAAIVSNDDDKDVGELVGVDLSEDGLACRRRGFAVVVGAELLPTRPQHVGIADVARVEILLAILRQEFLHLIDVLDMMGKGEELTPLLRVESFAYVRGYRLVFVSHVLIS